jgi:hypothetical protein
MRNNSFTEEPVARGVAVATVLAGSWRQLPPKLRISPTQVSRIVPQLLIAGAGALASRRVRKSRLSLPTADAQQLRSKYVDYALQAIICEQEIIDVVRCLRARGIDPILIKGWAAGRHYAASTLRPSGDIDICVAPEEMPEAQAVVSKRRSGSHAVDLYHEEIDLLDSSDFDDLAQHAETVSLAGDKVRVLGAEDNLRILCLHFLKHGAWRAVWLCDITAALEARRKNFDWDRCLGTGKPRANWVLSVLGLAHELLGADSTGTPAETVTGRLPGWFVACVLKEWNRTDLPTQPKFVSQVTRVRRPAAVFEMLRKRWPNRIQGTIDARGNFDDRSPLPFQVRQGLVRLGKLLSSR